MNKIIFGIILVIATSMCFADSLYDNINNQEDTSLDNNNSSLDKDYTVNKLFTNFAQVTSILNDLGIPTKIVNIEDNEPSNVHISSSTSVKDFIKEAASKFGYSYTSKDGTLIFTAINPKIIKPKSTVILGSSNKPKFPSVSWTLNSQEKTLRNALTAWCKTANWQLVWNVHADYPITTSWTISGSFESAINEVLKASQSTDTPLQAVMHDSNRVLEVYSPAISK